VYCIIEIINLTKLYGDDAMQSESEDSKLAAYGGMTVFAVCAIMWWKLLAALAFFVFIGGSVVHYFKKGK